MNSGDWKTIYKCRKYCLATANLFFFCFFFKVSIGFSMDGRYWLSMVAYEFDAFVIWSSIFYDKLLLIYLFTWCSLFSIKIENHIKDNKIQYDYTNLDIDNLNANNNNNHKYSNSCREAGTVRNKCNALWMRRDHNTVVQTNVIFNCEPFTEFDHLSPPKCLVPSKYLFTYVYNSKAVSVFIRIPAEVCLKSLSRAHQRSHFYFQLTDAKRIQCIWFRKCILFVLEILCFILNIIFYGPIYLHSINFSMQIRVYFFRRWYDISANCHVNAICQWPYWHFRIISCCI